jgi:hypothetical protein
VRVARGSVVVGTTALEAPDAGGADEDAAAEEAAEDAGAWR